MSEILGISDYDFSGQQANKFSSSDEFVSNLVPAVSYVENCVDTKTRIRVYMSEGQLDAGEKLQVKLESAE